MCPMLMGSRSEGIQREGILHVYVGSAASYLDPDSPRSTLSSREDNVECPKCRGRVCARRLARIVS